LQEQIRLTPTSFIVLGLLRDLGESTPYDLKRALAASVANFWSVPHAQLYREADRLASGGFVADRREESGRRRRFYAITDRGSTALAEWLGEAPAEPPELRAAGVLKIFFGADPAAVAAQQRPLHEAKLAEFEARHRKLARSGAPVGWLRALELGMAYERGAIERWS
jgi:DNA-binding PadR family transcriptional regulator